MKEALDTRARTDRIKASETLPERFVASKTLPDVSPSVKPVQIKEGSVVRVHGLVSRCILLLI
jgi:hypothetical protein